MAKDKKYRVILIRLINHATKEDVVAQIKFGLDAKFINDKRMLSLESFTKEEAENLKNRIEIAYGKAEVEEVK